MINVGSDFSGVGAFDQALIRLGIDYKTVFSCDMDKYARQTYIHNYGNKKDRELSKIPLPSNLAVALGMPDSNIRDMLKEFAHPEEFSFYYPYNVYQRKIPKEPLDIYMTSPPCQAFSLAGKRKGEDDKRGVLFYNSHEFIVKNKPRYFIFENVKGLLSDDGGKTFQRWLDYLGGKSVNGNPVIFPLEESVPYHIYHKVLNAKDYGVPQNRERVFIIGIRDDADNTFNWPKPIHLTKRLKDVLEENVDEKYYLSGKMIDGFVNHKKQNQEKGYGFGWNPTNGNTLANCLQTNAATRPDANYIIKEGFISQDTQASQVFSEAGTSPNICSGTHGYANGYVKIGAIRGRNPENPMSRVVGLPTEQRLEINHNGTSNALTTVQKDNVVIIDHRGHLNKEPNIIRNGIIPTLRAESHGHQPKIVVQLNPSKESGGAQPYQQNRVFDKNGISPAILANLGGDRNHNINTHKIRRLTPKECFRLMDFNESFSWTVSDTQAYKQAGNSIVVACLENIIKNLKL